MAAPSSQRHFSSCTLVALRKESRVIQGDRDDPRSTNNDRPAHLEVNSLRLSGDRGMAHRSLNILRPALLVMTLTQCTEPSAPPIEPCLSLERFDSTMVQFMETQNIKAGVLGVMKGGRLVYDKSFGWQDEAQEITLPQGAMMRLASVTKPITAAAVRELIDSELVDLDDFVFDLGQPEGGILTLMPFPSLGDSLLKKITVQHLLQHRGGWDRDLAGDLTFKEIVIADAMNVPSPPGRTNTIRYILGQPLQFSPGTKTAYANIGYLVLGLIVEEVSGEDFLSYVTTTLFEPLGVPNGELIQGRTFPVDRSPREPWYDSDTMSQNVFDPNGPPVEIPNGGWDVESRISSGGLVGSARSIVEFLDVYQTAGDGIGTRRRGAEGSGWRWYHTGSLPGTNTLARQRGDGINYAVLFNKRPSAGESYSSQIRSKIDAILDSEFLCWP
mgnify:CR=1 FL=1